MNELQFLLAIYVVLIILFIISVISTICVISQQRKRFIDFIKEELRNGRN